MNTYYLVAYDPANPDGDWSDPAAVRLLGGDHEFNRLDTKVDGKPPRAIAAIKGMSVNQMVDKIVALAEQEKEKINLLRLHSHGLPGHLFLGTLLAVESIGPFGRLKEHFDQRPGRRREIKIHACYAASDWWTPEDLGPYRGRCNVASAQETARCGVRGKFVKGNEHKGLQLMQGLAHLTGAAVQAGIELQYTSLHWRGPTLYVYPDGSTVWLVYPTDADMPEIEQYDPDARIGDMGEWVWDPVTQKPRFKRYAQRVREKPPKQPEPMVPDPVDYDILIKEAEQRFKREQPHKGNVRPGNENRHKPGPKKR